MTAYVLTTEAEADLRGIIRYTRKEWGTAQVRRYIGDLDEGIATLAAGQGLFTDMGEVYPALRLRVATITISFCLPRAGMPALIVAILPERMDLMTRLTGRLNAQ
ncbi:type II toxin-antitoxin system RelE/ParE family toxin [Pseudorhizobium pelagicum]|uniref:Plasmid stabilization protein ParE n=1 Tax=Pseudorhizobium pelagicum TaxID=1509405 RepID=A0A922P091_9HYPH|nr:type II toxin-antitoxin system RelE/ParE family toxin [Pseudorhizobium pelagicum]KEQ02932.1 plasmid stabilization protein ParE [Pseudorhizobium pelagicum]KEQ04873.1 plasmid stabilization protein ParE [Pseudorhizobium pelagicum]